ncbi:MAG TPA: glycosyltransferase family 4 protein [Solirubrobacteraceae bacterium]|nr:glycosyltransferase family 4 protein [Solirubrobacteraceae bacterium]
MRVQVVDPSAFTPPYDHALCSALARGGADVELVTSRFAYGATAAPDGYRLTERFYRHARGVPGSALRRATKLAEHVPDMLALRRAARSADVVHFQWLDVPWLDGALLPPRPTVLTAHDLLPREPRPGQAAAQRRLLRAVDAVIAHSEYGRARLVDGLGIDPDKVHVIRHGAFEHLTRLPAPAPLPPELAGAERPVALFFGLLRPYKGLDTLLRAWRVLDAEAELWVVGRPMMDLAPLRALATETVRFVPRFVADEELPALFRGADLIVLPYARTERFDMSGVIAAALAFGKPVVVSEIGGFSELRSTGAVSLVPPGDATALAVALRELLGDGALRARMSAAATTAAAGPYSWDRAGADTIALYRSLLP